MSFGKCASKSGTEQRKVPGMSALAIRECLIVEFPRAIQQVQETAKVIAWNVDTTKRAIEGQRQGEHLPSLPVGLALARQYPPIKKLFLKLMEAETGDSGDEPAAILDQIQKLAAKLAGRNGA